MKKFLEFLAHCGTMRHMKPKKTEEVKARVDDATKTRLVQLANLRELDLSDVLREAIREFLARNSQLTMS